MTVAHPTISRDPYLELVLSFPLRPIRTRGAHQKAKAILRGLANKRDVASRDYKIVLASLIADYESSAHLRLDTSKVTVAQIVLHLLEERGMSVSALAKTLAISQSSLSDALHGRRGWSKSVIVRVSGFFGLEPVLFLK